MDKISKEQIIASSSGWVAGLLNFLPGLGSGYLYQRRWRAYFLTAGAVTIWFAIGIFLQGDKETTQTEQLIGITGLLLISLITVIEANFAFKKAVKTAEVKIEQTKSTSKKLWFN